MRFLVTHSCDVQPDAITCREKGKTIGKNSRAKSNVFLKLYCVILLRQWPKSVVVSFDMAAPPTKTLNDLDGIWTLVRLSQDAILLVISHV